MAQNPSPHPQPSPWSRSEELDPFCIRVFKKSNHNKVELASFEPLGCVCLSGQSCLFTRQCCLLQAFSCRNLAFPRSVNTESEAASVWPMCPSGLRMRSVRLQGRRGGRGRLCPGSPHIGQGNNRRLSQELSLPFPSTPTQVEGEQLSPEPMLVKVSAQHRSDISSEPEMTVTCVGGIPYS